MKTKLFSRSGPPMSHAAAHALLDAIRSNLGAGIPRADIDRALELTGDLAEPLAPGREWRGLGEGVAA